MSQWVKYFNVEKLSLKVRCVLESDRIYIYMYVSTMDHFCDVEIGKLTTKTLVENKVSLRSILLRFLL